MPSYFSDDSGINFEKLLPDAESLAKMITGLQGEETSAVVTLMNINPEAVSTATILIFGGVLRCIGTLSGEVTLSFTNSSPFSRGVYS